MTISRYATGNSQCNVPMVFSLNYHISWVYFVYIVLDKRGKPKKYIINTIIMYFYHYKLSQLPKIIKKSTMII